MIQIDLYQAREQFLEIIEQVLRGEEVVIKRDQQPLVKMTAVKGGKVKRQFGSAKGMIVIAHDFDQPLDDFRDYM